MSPSRAALQVLVSISLSACVSSVVVQEGGLDNPPVTEKGVVVLFTGLVPAGDSMANSGMYTLTQEIRASGIRADVYNPSHWQKAADMVLAQPDVDRVPVAVGGYSMGGGAATRFAERLREAGIVVQTLLVFEPYYPAPVGCNVREAIDMYGGVGSFNFARRLQTSRTFRGHLTQVNWTKWNPKDGRHDHWGVSTEPEALHFVKEELIDGGTVRMRPAPPGEEQCLGKLQHASSPSLNQSPPPPP